MSNLRMKRSSSYNSSSSPVPADIARCDHGLAGGHGGLRNGAWNEVWLVNTGRRPINQPSSEANRSRRGIMADRNEVTN